MTDKGKVKGKNIVNAHTLGSMYDHDCIGLVDKAHKEYRISASELIKMIKHFEFNSELARVHTYLYVVDKKGGETIKS